MPLFLPLVIAESCSFGAWERLRVGLVSSNWAVFWLAAGAR
jgi:hypothetical protein